MSQLGPPRIILWVGTFMIITILIPLEAHSLNFSYEGTRIEKGLSIIPVSVQNSTQPFEVTISSSSLAPIVSESTVALKGANGATITSESVVGGEALMVINKGATSLSGLTYVYVSSRNFVVGSTLTLTGLGNLAELQSYSGNCDWSIDSGNLIRVSTDTERRFPMEHLILNPDVHLVAKNNSGVICTAFVSGAN